MDDCWAPRACPRTSGSAITTCNRSASSFWAGASTSALTDEVPEFAPFRDATLPLLTPFHLTASKVAFESTLIEKANWKLVMENARECYHCAASHPELKHSFPVNFGQGFSFGEDERGRL